MAGSGLYARGDQPRTVPDSLADPYGAMAAQQRAYNARQQAALTPNRAVGTAPETVSSLADWMYRPSESDVAELRRQQAAFKETEHAISRENSWMAVPALAPAAAVFGLEAAGMVAARLAPAVAPYIPIVRDKFFPYPRVGDNWATRKGRRAHADLRARVQQKPNLESEPYVKLPNGRILRPDVRTPPRVRAAGEDPVPYQMELKPNTPSGRRAALRAEKKYEATGVTTRPIYYDPKRFK